MSRLLERRVAELATTKTVKKLGWKRWNQLVNRATVTDSFEDLSANDKAIIKNAELEILTTAANVYLDIDGVLLGKKGKPAIGLNYFLKTLHKLGNDIYWLTTHCNGDASTASKYVASHLKSPLSKIIVEQFKPTTWNVKTQGINFDKPFLWFDDKPLGWADKDTMKKYGVASSLVIVDLEKNPFALVFIASKLRKILKKAAQAE